jgi:hypothetical protein
MPGARDGRRPFMPTGLRTFDRKSDVRHDRAALVGNLA